jgi:membrane protein DedA with SNARE-associated domain
VEQFLLDFLGSASGLGAYGLVFGVLLACGLGLPLPEDVALITGGYLAFQGHANLQVMLVVGFLGILAGDSAVFYLGRAGREATGKAPTGLLKRHLTPERLARVEAQFRRRGPLMVMVARFLPGVRAATYFVAGGAKMKYHRFIVFDGLAALISAPVFVLAGHHFGGEIGRVIDWAKEFHNYLIGAVVVAAVAFVAYRLLRRRPERAVATTEPEVLPEQPLAPVVPIAAKERRAPESLIQKRAAP